MEQSGTNNPKVGTRQKQSGNKVGPRTQMWEEERNKLGNKRGQEPESGNKRGTIEEQSGNKSDEAKEGTRDEEKCEPSGIKNPKVATREEQSVNKMGPRIYK